MIGDVCRLSTEELRWLVRRLNGRYLSDIIFGSRAIRL